MRDNPREGRERQKEKRERERDRGRGRERERERERREAPDGPLSAFRMQLYCNLATADARCPDP